MREGPTVSRAGLAGEPASAVEAVTDRLPPAFVDCLLDSALEPVLDAAAQRGEQAARRKKNGNEATEVARALLAVTVCDPACGSGSLLVAAARRIARRVAQAREGNPAPDALRRAMREVVGNCVYGVDLSDEAVEQAKDRLRRAADVPGMRPPFLDGRVRQGNALIGASPELIESGVPDEAFRPADGDDRGYARFLRRANAKPNPGQATLFSEQGGYAHSNEALAKSLAKIGQVHGGEPADERRQAAEYRKWRDSAAFRAKRLVADAWCAAFAWAKTPDAPRVIVNRVLMDLRERGAEGILPETLGEIDRLRGEHLFFHWHLEFPDVFRVGESETRWRGGFSCVLSAPPREKIDRRGKSAVFGFATRSGAYPECAAGLAEPGASALGADLLFAERAAAILAPEGRAGLAVAPGTAAAPGARHLLGGLMRRGALASLYDFAGPAARLCLLTFAGDPVPGGPVPGDPVPGGTVRAGTPPGRTARFAFWLDDPAELGADGRSFPLTPGEVALINPNTGALPAFRCARDAALTSAIYRRVPALWDETRADGNPWKMRLATAFPRAAADTGLLRTERELRDEGWELAGSTFTRDGQRMLPVYEPPMIGLFDHERAKPRHWIAEYGPVAVQRKGETAERPGIADRLAELGWTWEWLCAWRAPVLDRPVPDRPVPDRPVPDRPVLDRIAVAVFLPRAAAAGSLPLMLPRVVPPFAAALISAQSSLVFEYVARQKIDGPVVRAAHWKQLPVPAPDMLEPHLPFIVPRVLELVCTSSDMGPLSRDLDDAGDPFAWDPDRRAGLRAELDAFFFRGYGIDSRDDVAYIIDTLQARADGIERGESQGQSRDESRDESQGQSRGDDGRRARELTLAAYDRMAEAEAAGAEYETRIFPPPGHGPRRQLS
jgi:RMKL-like, methyltransferase domain